MINLYESAATRVVDETFNLECGVIILGSGNILTSLCTYHEVAVPWVFLVDG